MKLRSVDLRVLLSKPILVVLPIVSLVSAGCGGSDASSGSTGGGSGSAGASAQAGAAGSVVVGTSGAGGAGGATQASGGAGASATGGVGAGGSTAGAGGSAAGAAGSGGATAGAAGAGGAIGTAGAGGSVNNVPGDYKGTPYTALQIPGKINACDYDRGGAGVAWCHDMGNCSAGTLTGDYPGGSGVYRTPMPANAKICSGAACDDNVGVCRMNPQKPDNTINGQAMPATDTYLCYSVAGEWTKYTVVVAQAGTYSVGGTMAVPQNGGFNLSFGGNITTGNVALAITPTTHSGTGENFHSWDTRSALGTVTFPAAGSYVMTLTQVGRFNADSFTFTKM
jgi:hypothetical protein